MNSTRAEKNIQLIESVFREVQENFPTGSTNTQLKEVLDKYNSDFRSVAYESASMCMALHDLKLGLPLTRWKDFLQSYGNDYPVQYHIGLGWALAQMQISPISCLSLLEPEYAGHIADGYGYYEGFFRRRRSIEQKLMPQWTEEWALENYDQGIGRSLWYTFKADVIRTVESIAAFPPERQAFIFKGLGIAMAFTKAMESDEKVEAFIPIEFYSQFLEGVSLASKNSAGIVQQNHLNNLN